MCRKCLHVKLLPVAWQTWKPVRFGKTQGFLNSLGFVANFLVWRSALRTSELPFASLALGIEEFRLRSRSIWTQCVIGCELRGPFSSTGHNSAM